jgi:hypothetical protein
MGLDWEPFGKPKPGFEAECWTLMGQLTKEKNWLQPSPVRHSPIPAGETRESLRERWKAISISPYETLRAPRVGSDPAADAWIRSQYGIVPNRPVPIDEWVQKYDGFYVLALVPENDGLPLYSNYGLDSWSWERWSFRAQFLTGCRDILGEALLEDAWVRHTAPQLTDYSERLMSCAAAYAETHGVTDVLPLRLLDDNVTRVAMADVAYVSGQPAVHGDSESPRFKAHLIVSAARWAAFWASHGHGLYANY